MFRFDAGIVMKNIFQVFDTSNTGKIFPNELIWVFSMSIQGKGKIYSNSMIKNK